MAKKKGSQQGVHPKSAPVTPMPFRVKKNPRDQGILHALLPGSRLDKNTHKILVHTATSNEAIKFNVGGTLFETYKSTLRSVPHCLLADNSFLVKHHRPEQNEYFFDRDPNIFHCILNYLRSGELHLPTSVCGPVVKSELEYWGIDETEIEECCWSRYASWATTLTSLRKLEADRTGNALQWQTAENKKSCCKIFHHNAWNFFVDPTSSLASSIYSYVSLTIIFISIFCFCAETHRDFQVESTVLKVNQSAVTTNTLTRIDAMPHTSNGTTTKPLPTDPTNSFYKVYETEPHPILHYLDLSSFIFILVELVVRFVVCPRKIRFLLQPMTLIECLALAPDVCEIILDSAGLYYVQGILDFMRIFRVFRIFRLMRQIPGLWILIYTLKASFKDLVLLLLFLCLGMLIFSSLVYFAEKDEDGTGFTSIPKSFWWAVITMTTVGYGDMSPETRFGYLVGTLTAVSGLLMIGFTVPVLVNNFVLYYNHTQSTIDREKQRAKMAKHARENRGNCHGEAKSPNHNDKDTRPGLFMNFSQFKQLGNGTADAKQTTTTTTTTTTTSTKESSLDDNDNDNKSTSNFEEVDGTDVKIVVDESSHGDVAKVSEKNITAL